MLRILGGNPQNYNFNPENMKTLDNFLEANLDAQLIQDEIKIDSELEKVPDKDLECLLNDFLKYTKEWVVRAVTPSNQFYIVPLLR